MKSIQPRIQRKSVFNADSRSRRLIMSSHLSKELRAQYKRRAMPLAEGDVVVVASGEYSGKTGKVSKIDRSSYNVFVEGITSKRTVGTEVQVPLHPSNLSITGLNLEDEMRRKVLLRKVKEVKYEKPKQEERKTENKKEEKIDETKKNAGSKVLEDTEKGKHVDSVTKARPAQKV